jgi:hypothetical protein
MAKITAALDRARSTLAEINARSAEATAKRKARLLAGDSAISIGKLDAEITDLQRAAGTEVDRIRLLEVEAQREEAETVAKRRSALTERFAAKLAEADALADALQADLARVEKTFRQIIKLRETARAAWPIGDSHHNAVAETPEGAAMSGGAVAALLKYELYRIGARPFLGGHPGARGEVAFPGGACPDLRWQMAPEKIVPFGTALRNASRFAVDAMRGKLDPLVALPPAPSDAAAAMNTDAGQRLSRLLSEQNRLAADVSPEGERKYHEVVAEIARVQGEVANAGAST